MAKLSILAGATSQSVNLFIQDSSSTTGAGLTGLVYNTSGLTAYFTFAGANAAVLQITLATLASNVSAWSSGGFLELSSAHMPGWYRFDIPNLVISAGEGRSVAIHFQGAANMAPLPLEIELTGWDNQDGVRGGLTALPNAAANAAGGLPVSIAGGLDLDEQNADIEAIQTTLGAPVGASLSADIAGVPNALLDETNGVETSYTLRQSLRLILASVVAKLSGAATTTVTIRDINDTKNRITATVDASGNRTAVTADGT